LYKLLKMLADNIRKGGFYMKNFFKLFFIAMILTVSCLMMGCSGSGSIIGKWEHHSGDRSLDFFFDSDIIEFYSNGKVTADANIYWDGTWTILDGEPKRFRVRSDSGNSMIFTYEIKRGLLTITDEDYRERIYKKVK